MELIQPTRHESARWAGGNGQARTEASGCCWSIPIRAITPIG